MTYNHLATAIGSEGKSHMLQLNPDVRFHLFDDAKGLYTCELPTNNGAFRCVLPKSFVRLLEQCDGTKTPEEAFVGCSENKTLEYRAKVLQLIQGYFRDNRILVDSEGGEVLSPPASPLQKASSPMARVYFRIPLLRGRLVRAMVVALSPLFDKRVVTVLLVTACLAHVQFYSHAGQLSTQINTLSGIDLFVVVVATLLSALFHELGHVTALLRNGGRTVEIGFGIYIMFPVFYANVSECWNFPRRRRLEVNVGGLYFQSVALLILCIANMWQPSFGLAFSIVWIDLLIIRNLNPFLRMDGYWILADLLGVPSLHRSAATELKRTFRYLVSKHRNDSPRTSRISHVLILYCLSAVIVFGVVYYRFAELIILGVVPKLPSRIHMLAAAATRPDPLAMIASVFSLLWEIMMVYVFVDTISGFTRQYLPRFVGYLKTLSRPSICV